MALRRFLAVAVAALALAAPARASGISIDDLRFVEARLALREQGFRVLCYRRIKTVMFCAGRYRRYYVALEVTIPRPGRFRVDVSVGGKRTVKFVRFGPGSLDA